MNFFFSSRRRHTRYWRDWSSDVCSSDLGAQCGGRLLGGRLGAGDRRRPVRVRRGRPLAAVVPPSAATAVLAQGRDRESVVEGKRVDLGGRRTIKKKKFNKTYVNTERRCD